MRGILVWWRQPDHYEWLSDYLARRGLTGPTRHLLAVIVTLLATATLLMMFSPSGPRDTPARAIGAAVIVGFLVIAGVYLRRWPDRVVSQALSICGTLAIAVACLIDSDPRSGMLGCAAFIGLAGYISFFHNARCLALTLVIAVLTAALCAARVAADGDPAMAVARLLVMTGGIIAVPFCGQLLVRWLSVDALKSSTDALTGLRNRRGFDRAARDLLTSAPADPDLCLVVVMVDLDGFKQVNDTYGHATGDIILVSVADALREASSDRAVVGRVGGEEFVLAEIMACGDAAGTAERLRGAIAATSWRVTASLGFAATAVAGVAAVAEATDGARELITGLMTAADTAMYEAKRAGGNQIRRADVPMRWMS